MPAMDGHQLIRCIRTLDAERGGRTPAAALTAYATPADRTRALLAGFQVYLAKPFDPSGLVTRVAHPAGRARAARADASRVPSTPLHAGRPVVTMCRRARRAVGRGAPATSIRRA